MISDDIKLLPWNVKKISASDKAQNLFAFKGVESKICCLHGHLVLVYGCHMFWQKHIWCASGLDFWGYSWILLKVQYCPLCFTRLCYCFGLHRREASIVQRHMKHTGNRQYWVVNMHGHRDRAIWWSWPYTYSGIVWLKVWSLWDFLHEYLCLYSLHLA